MTSSPISLCTRCGKPRVVEKQWIESHTTLSGEATVAYTKLVCADSECQKEVDAALVQAAEKRDGAKRFAWAKRT